MSSDNGNKQPHFTVLSVPADDLLPASRHSKIEQLADDVFFVRGRMPTTPTRPLFARLFLHFSRTMTIVRHSNEQGDYELTIFNSLRLSDEGLEQLNKLGTVKHIVRLGSFHGIDDAFYVQHYNAEYWIVDGMQSAKNLAATPRHLSETNASARPIANTDVFIFSDIPYPEAIYILPQTEHRAGLAITTDSIQNHTSIWDVDNSLLVSFGIWRIGLLGPARLGPIWLREQAQKNAKQQSSKRNLAQFFRPQFERLLSDYNFDMLVPGHGWPIRRGAKALIEQSIEGQLKIDQDILDN